MSLFNVCLPIKKKTVDHLVFFLNICFDSRMVVLSVLKIMSQTGSYGNIFGYVKSEIEIMCMRFSSVFIFIHLYVSHYSCTMVMAF